jgi:hypothetical protein
MLCLDWDSIPPPPCIRFVNFCCSYNIFIFMFSSITAVYCRAERYPHIGVPFKMKDLATFFRNSHAVYPRNVIFFPHLLRFHSLRRVYLKRRHKRVEVRHDVWGPSLSVTLRPGCWTWSFPTFWTSSTRSVGFSEMWTSFQQIMSQRITQ